MQNPNRGPNRCTSAHRGRTHGRPSPPSPPVPPALSRTGSGSSPDPTRRPPQAPQQSSALVRSGGRAPNRRTRRARRPGTPLRNPPPLGRPQDLGISDLNGPPQSGPEHCSHRRNARRGHHGPAGTPRPPPRRPHPLPLGPRHREAPGGPRRTTFPRVPLAPELHLPEGSAARLALSPFGFPRVRGCGEGALGCAPHNKCWSSFPRKTSQQGRSMRFSTKLRY